MSFPRATPRRAHHPPRDPLKLITSVGRLNTLPYHFSSSSILSLLSEPWNPIYVLLSLPFASSTCLTHAGLNDSLLKKEGESLLQACHMKRCGTGAKHRGRRGRQSSQGHKSITSPCHVPCWPGHDCDTCELNVSRLAPMPGRPSLTLPTSSSCPKSFHPAASPRRN